MRYPVGDGSKETFLRDWYSAQRHGQQTLYGYHDGEDFNLRTGGDSDLGQPIYAIANGNIEYWHYADHPATPNTFGRHLIYRVAGPWGERWIHLAHLAAEDFGGAQARAGDAIAEGALIGRIGKSGTVLAHLHFAVLKVRPTNIDNVANSRVELDTFWEDPIAFIDRWMTAPVPVPAPAITDQTLIPQIENRSVAAIREELFAIRAKLASIRTIVA